MPSFIFHKKQLISVFMICSIGTVVYNFFNPPSIPDPFKEISQFNRTDISFIDDSKKLDTNTKLTKIQDFIHSSSVLESLTLRLILSHKEDETTSPTSDDMTQYFKYLVFISNELKNFKPMSEYDNTNILQLKHNIVRLYSIIGTPQFIDVQQTYLSNKNNPDFQALINEQKSEQLWKEYFSSKYGNDIFLQTYIYDGSYTNHITELNLNKISSQIN